MSLVVQFAFAQSNSGSVRQNNNLRMQDDKNLSEKSRRSSFVMTDEEIIEYIKEEQKKGTDNNKIVTDLMRRGVTTEQLNNLRNKYIKDSKKLKVQKDDDESLVRLRDKNSMVDDFGYVRDSLDVLLPD